VLAGSVGVGVGVGKMVGMGVNVAVGVNVGLGDGLRPQAESNKPGNSRKIIMDLRWFFMDFSPLNGCLPTTSFEGFQAAFHSYSYNIAWVGKSINIIMRIHFIFY
jgi:hypothetical protein